MPQTEADLPLAGTPTTAEVERIGRMADPVLRNLLITLTYHRLDAAMRESLGGCANWCTFATWASRQAGQTIRGEDLVEALRHRLRLPARVTHPIHSLWRKVLAKGLFNPETRLGRFVRVVQGPLDPFERSSEAVARGNLKVFQEIAWVFARFLAVEREPPGPERLERFLGELRDDEPPDGQRLLRQAFAKYDRAVAEAEPGRRAVLVYLANVDIGFHEQTRLQPEIAEALDAPVVELRQLGLRVLAFLAPGSSAWWKLLRTAAASVLGTLTWPLAAAWRRLAREVVTERLMVLRIPADRILRLGANLDAPYPASLDRIEDAEAQRLLHQLRCGSDPHECGATDWAELHQRMHYIAHLFRAFQEDVSLAAPPFTTRQLADIDAGRIPDGEL